MAVRIFGTRLTVEGAQQYETTMRRAGRAGQESLDRVARAARPASGALRLVSGASAELQGSVRNLAGSVPVVGRLAGAMGPVGLAIGAVAGGIVALGAGAKNAAAEIAKIGDAADRAGIDAGVFEGLGAALRLEGQSDGGLEVALSTFNRVLGEARAGSKGAGEAFRALGVDLAAVSAAGETSEDVLFRIADGLAAIPNPADRAAVAQRLFGEQGRALVLALDGGSEALRGQIAEAEKLGLLFGGETIRSAQQLNAEFDKQQRIVSVQLKRAFLGAGPAIRDLGENFVTLIPVITNFIGVVAAGTNELLALIGLASRPIRVQLETNLKQIESLDETLRKTEAGDLPVSQFLEGLGVLDRDKGIADLKAKREALAAENAKLADELARENALLDRLAQPTTITVDNAGLGLGGGAGKGKQDRFSAEAERVAQRIADLRREAEAVNLTTEAAARLEAQARLLTAAQEDGRQVTAEELEVIRKLAEEFGVATAARERSADAARAATDAERDAARAAEQLKDSTDGLGRDLGAALGGLTTKTLTWRDALGQVLSTVIRIIEQPLADALSGAGGGGGIGGSIVSGIGGFIGSLFGGGFADGAAFSRGRVVPFAAGGLVTGPTMFPLAGGRTGLMGEAGPEGILPLTRLPGGQLGVSAEGAGAAGPQFVFSVDARGSTMSPEQWRAIARQEVERGISQYDRQAAAPSVRGASVRLRS